MDQRIGHLRIRTGDIMCKGVLCKQKGGTLHMFRIISSPQGVHYAAVKLSAYCVRNNRVVRHLAK
jgi:hypothetical protein